MTSERRYRVGTSGWQYDHWRYTFYPEDLPKRDWFSYYSRNFDCVELNNSFYRQPKDQTWDHWHDAAPPGFRFAVKANRFITHMKRFKDCEEPLRRFLAGARRLKTSLGPILYQTPPNFECSEGNLERLDTFLSLLPAELEHVFEFRNAQWFGAEALDLLRAHGAGFCIQDMPGMECPVAVTAGYAYLRFHGVDQPYSGLYSDQALEAWARTIRDLEGVDDIWAFFNNDANANAVANARTLARLLTTGD
jgi:uncharacterized protein YecE (DUF72 family)